MRLAIFGATGKTGGQLVERALGLGYEVVAFARTPSKIAVHDARLSTVAGDAVDPAAVDRAVQGADAVICVLNTSFDYGIAKTHPVTRITRNILNSMNAFGVRRLIMTSAGIPQPNDRPDLRFGLLLWIGRLVMPPAVEDTIKSARMVQSSDVDWTIFRMVPTDAAATGRVEAGYISKEVKVFVSRADAAMFILRELKENNWVRQAPVIFNP